MNRPPTLRDVAEKANVHTSTASRALNERTQDMITPITVKRVRAAADALGYQPIPLARGLKTRRTLTVGMLIPALTTPLFPPIVRGIEDRFRASDYTLLLANTDQDTSRERQIIGVMQARHVDGIIVATARREHPVLDKLQQAGMPLVLVNRVADLPVVSSVTADDHSGVGQAMRHLISLGHRRIAHVAADDPELCVGLDPGRLAGERVDVVAALQGVLDDDTARAAGRAEDGQAQWVLFVDRSNLSGTRVPVSCYSALVVPRRQPWRQ